jgi:predicted Rossmann fold nucleotide-binding protein DprA/Smf involved in DNA uptake
VLEALGWGREPQSPVSGPTAAHPTDGLDPDVARVYDALPFKVSRTVAQLSVESGLAAVEVMAAVAELEIRELVSRNHGQWQRRRGPG